MSWPPRGMPSDDRPGTHHPWGLTREGMETALRPFKGFVGPVIRRGMPCTYSLAYEPSKWRRASPRTTVEKRA